MRREAVDVTIIGSGFGGAAFAHRLAERAPRLRIVVLERGDWVDRGAMAPLLPDWQALSLGAWSTSPVVRMGHANRAPSADYPIDDTGSDFKPLMWNGVGGSTIAWAGHFPRLHPSDFRTRTLDQVGDDWPFDYFDLEPWYDLNDEVVGVAGLAGDPAYPPKPKRVMPPLPLGRLGARAARGFDALGWHWWPVDAAVNTVLRDGRPACNHCGPCGQGCVSAAKSSVDRTHLPRALRLGVELRTRAVVQHIDVEAGRATAVRYRDHEGRDIVQPTEHVIVACNGIGTPRLLLASGIESPALGRYLMYHGVGYVRGMFHEEMDGPVGPAGLSIYSHEFYETDRGRGFVRGIQFQVTRENALLTQATRLEPAWGAGAQRALREEFRHSISILAMNEDLPEPENRVTLTSDIAADGLPGVKVTYRLDDNARRSLAFGLDRAEEALQAMGAYRVSRLALAPYTGWHLLGTARMGTDPRTSVTDARGRLHAVPNIRVADGSLFPTVGALNPGSTIGALALKLADELATEIGP